ncbi:MAG: PQQ-like beta-propeller repeat protein [Oscillospiraceae bacterium]|nr:PQQ-like beta-propeller repeat protein [Oscillospiraceae bacterium]
MKKTIIILSVAFALLLLVLCGLLFMTRTPAPPAAETPPATEQPTETTAPPTEATTVPTEPETEPEETTEPAPTEPPFVPMAVDGTRAEDWEIDWRIIENDTVIESFTRQDPIFFGDDYYQLPGIAGFRGGNYRTDASYGTADIQSGTIKQLWKMNVGYLETVDWIGCGWTGQPLVAQWDAETRAIMNLYDEKKEKDGLVEAVYAKMDGYIHFIDMEDGSQTRDPLYVGWVFKGSGALDPRGYPIVYLGAGLTKNGSVPQKIFAISLIDGSTLFELSGYNPLAPRYWCGFDSGPLVHGETDTLIYAGENGLIYTIKLNTNYDKAAGTLTMEPDAPVMTAYTSSYSKAGRYLGYEASIAAADQYLYLGDNAGLIQCVNVNTMELVWAQSILDDVNATPLFDWGTDGRGYLYAAPSVDYNRGEVSLYKLDAQTGEILWTYEMKCSTDPDAPGGMLASPLLGKNGTSMENIVIFSVGRTPSPGKGQMYAFDKTTGELLWQFETNSYIWSSPVALYTQDGTGYIFQADARGNCYLMNGATGEVMNTVSLKQTTEASPIAFGNHILLGTRSAMYLFEIQ